VQQAETRFHDTPKRVRLVLLALILALLATLALAAGAHAETAGAGSETVKVLVSEEPSEFEHEGKETTGEGSGSEVTLPPEEPAEVIPPVEEVVAPVEEVVAPVEEVLSAPVETVNPAPVEEGAKAALPAEITSTESSSQAILGGGDHSDSGPTASQETLAYTATEITSETTAPTGAAALPLLAGPLEPQEPSAAELKLGENQHPGLLARVSLSCVTAMGGNSSDCTSVVLSPQSGLSTASNELATPSAPWNGANGGPPDNGGGSAVGNRPVGPSPGPPPSGASGGAAVGGSGLAPPAFLTLAGLLLLAGSLAMRRLRLSSRPWLTAFFVLIPERPG
jgi:hypothetical protein